MKNLVIPHTECDYFFVIDESAEFALISIKGFEFIVMEQPKFVEDIKTGNLHEVTLKIDNRVIRYVSHVSLAEVAKEKAIEDIKLDELKFMLASNNIQFNL